VANVLGFRKRRDARLAPLWERALGDGNDSPVGHGPYATSRCLGQVVRHRQRARTGTKAYVRWHVDGSVTAAWFEASRPAVGAYVLARGRYGHGPHHAEPVFLRRAEQLGVDPCRGACCLPAPATPGGQSPAPPTPDTEGMTSMTTTSLADAHRELVERCRMADAVDDWRERTLLGPLVDVADYVKRIGDHADSAHYRAEKAGCLMRSAIAVQCQALMAYAGWPDDGPAYATLDKAHELLETLASAVEAVAWSTARAAKEDVDRPGPYAADFDQLRSAARAVLAWADGQVNSARDDSGAR